MRKLNINDLLYLVNESKKIILSEAVTVSAAYRKYYNDLPEETYNAIVSSDPTYNSDKPDVMGKYGIWMLNQWKKGNIDENSLGNVVSNLKIFTKFINRIENKNLQSYKNPEELQRTVQPFIDNPNQNVSNRQKRMKVREDAENVYEDNEWVVIVPKSWEASKVYGANTKWCTTMKNDSHYYDYYSKQAPLYIVINKKTNVKYQIHMPERSYDWQFKGADDFEVPNPAYSLNFSTGLVDFFNSISNNMFEEHYLTESRKDLGYNFEFVINKEGPSIYKDGKIFKKLPSDVSNISPFDENNYAYIVYDEKENVMDTNGRIIFDKPFDMLAFRNNVFIICENNLENIGTADGRIVFNEWYKYVNTFSRSEICDKFIVGNGELFNILTIDNKFILKQWANDISQVNDDCVIISYEKKDGSANEKYLIDSNGNSLFKRSFSDIRQMRSTDLLKVEEDGYEMFAKCDGTVYSNMKFDNIRGMINSKLCIVDRNEKINFVNCDTIKLISDVWVDHYDSDSWFGDFDGENGYIKVWKDGKVNFISIDGKFLFDNWYDNVNTSNFYTINKFDTLLVTDNERYNFINKLKKDTVFDVWFDDIDYINDSVAVVMKDGKHNVILCDSSNGALRYVSNDWTEKYPIEDLIPDEDVFKMRIGDKWTVLSSDTKYTDELYDDIEHLYSLSVSVGYRGNDAYIIDWSGKPVGEFKDCKVYSVWKKSYMGRHILVKRNSDNMVTLIDYIDEIDKCRWIPFEQYVSDGNDMEVRSGELANVLTSKGNLVFNRWYYDIKMLNEWEMAAVIKNRNDGYSIMRKDGSLLNNFKFDDIAGHASNLNGNYLVKKDGEWNLLQRDGSILSKKWYKQLDRRFVNDTLLVKNENYYGYTSYNFINTRGEEIFNTDFEMASEFAMSGDDNRIYALVRDENGLKKKIYLDDIKEKL